MLLRERVAEWLDSQDDVTDVRPVQVWLHSLELEWQGAVFIRDGEQVYYLIGERPKHPDPTCYLIQTLDSDDLDSSGWYIGGYVEGLVDREVHPFGNHWILVPWIIKDDPESQIDDYADEPYERIALTVKES